MPSQTQRANLQIKKLKKFNEFYLLGEDLFEGTAEYLEGLDEVITWDYKDAVFTFVHNLTEDEHEYLRIFNSKFYDRLISFYNDIYKERIKRDEEDIFLEDLNIQDLKIRDV